ELQQSIAFLVNASWVGSNGIFVGTSTCWAQGYFVSVGDLAASCFISAIAVYTYLTVIRGYKPPQWVLYLTIACLWTFVYAMALMGILITDNGRGTGGLCVRAVAWCWVNVEYRNIRLWLHYFWIFLSLTLTSCLYILIFFSLQQRRIASRNSYASCSVKYDARTSPVSGTQPGFLIYPIIYVLCTIPLAMGRVLTMAGRDLGVGYFCFAGSMMASNGWLDVLLFSYTRSPIIFAASPDSVDTGLDKFIFMRTPHERSYGNIIWVQGPSGSNKN
ncbi:hypothetical protein BKA67DRAFT_498003, partial [Truncatella angustata]